MSGGGLGAGGLGAGGHSGGVLGGAPDAPAIALEDVSVSYGEVRALRGVRLAVPAGRVTALIGVNGSGKSTLFRTTLGMIRPHTGTVRLAGLAPARARRAGLVASVPQTEDIDRDFPVSVRDVAAMGRRRVAGQERLGRGGRRAADRSAVADAIERVGLSEVADRQIGRLSGGQRKRAFVARALAQEASILLLDEPFAGVDAASAATIARVLRARAAEGAAVLVATHDLASLPALADDAALLAGRILFHGAVADAIAPKRLAAAFGVDPRSEEAT